MKAIKDYDIAQKKGFRNLYALACSRGIVYRLLGRCKEAKEDFQKALNVIDKDDSVNKTIILSKLIFFSNSLFCTVGNVTIANFYEFVLH
jgi:tetratricopeptide (TPR) repeat protein